jgi:hypothetical protein
MIYSNKVVRVFISSTFYDMHAERDHLTRVVLPSLRRHWLPRGVDVVFVDLRWGITKDDSIRLGSTQLCLKEIDNRISAFPSTTAELFDTVLDWVEHELGRD